MSSKFIEIKNLKTHFFVDKDIIKAVNGVSLEIKENTTLCLVGERGSSTDSYTNLPLPTTPYV